MRAVVVDTPHYSRRYGGFPDYTACALVFHHAVAVGAEEIIVQCKGKQPHHYTMDQVREFLRKHPQYQRLAISTVPIPLLPGVYRQTPGAVLTPNQPPVSSNSCEPGREGEASC